jgi:hypothetical protein
MTHQIKKCWKCGAEFACGAQDSSARCWCEALPPVGPISAGADCLCSACLAQVAASRSRPREGEDYYREGAAIVFTAHYHLVRGHCCGNGCRHCPY